MIFGTTMHFSAVGMLAVAAFLAVAVLGWRKALLVAAILIGTPVGCIALAVHNMPPKPPHQHCPAEPVIGCN